MSKEKLEADKLLNTFYECKICGAMFSAERVDEALECARQPANPKYTIENKVIWRKCVVRIIERVIIPYSHKFLYRFQMKRIDNPPGTTIWANPGLVGEEDLAIYNKD